MCSPRSKVGAPAKNVGDVAVDPLHEAPAFGGKVVDELRLVEAQALEVDQIAADSTAGGCHENRHLA